MMTKPPQTNFQNTFMNDTLTSQRGPILGDIQKPSPEERATSHLSLSSDEYKSSTNDIRQNAPHPNGGLSPVSITTPSTDISNGNIGPPIQPVVIVTNDEYAVVNKKEKNGDDIVRQSKNQEKRSDKADRGEHSERRKRKHRNDREHSKDRRKHHNRSYEEVGESSKSNGDTGGVTGKGNWNEQNGINQSYDSVEYC